MGGKEQVSGRRHFYTFDALRFFAFFKVFLLHLPIVAFPWFNYLKAGGGIGVQFFFVLSGFLISYIILEEQKRTGTLHLKNFFVRRVLRIWPLYYLMVLVAYITPYILNNVLHLSSSSTGYEPQLWVSLTFLENYKMMITGTHANASPLSVMWSLCIEEHFYIIWGLALYFLKLKGAMRLIVVSLLVGVLSRVVYVWLGIPTSDVFTNIDLFALGALPAYYLIKYPERTEAFVDKISRKVKLLYVFSLLIIVTICSQYNEDKDFILLTSLLGVLFAGLILLTLGKKNALRVSDKTVLSKLGIYTYGLYLYHTLVINLLLQIFKKYDWGLEQSTTAVVFVVLALLLTIVISMLSYHLFEKQFLKLKKYFRNVS
ncbi:MAG: acyltransferase [Flavipsychrobacter sp.]